MSTTLSSPNFEYALSSPARRTADIAVIVFHWIRDERMLKQILELTEKPDV